MFTGVLGLLTEVMDFAVQISSANVSTVMLDNKEMQKK